MGWRTGTSGQKHPNLRHKRRDGGRRLGGQRGQILSRDDSVGREVIAPQMLLQDEE